MARRSAGVQQSFRNLSVVSTNISWSGVSSSSIRLPSGSSADIVCRSGHHGRGGGQRQPGQTPEGPATVPWRRWLGGAPGTFAWPRRWSRHHLRPAPATVLRSPAARAVAPGRQQASERRGESMTRDPLPDGTGVAVADPPSTTLSRHRTGVPLRPNRTGVPLRPNRTGVPLRPNRTVVTLRRNRTVAALSGLTATTAVFGSLPALGALEFVAATFGLLLAGYLAMTARLRALAAARDMSTAFGGAAGDLAWDDFVRQLSGSLAAPDAPSVRGATPRDRAGAPAARRVTAGEPAPGDATGEGGTIGGLDLLRFAGLYALGWALTPAA